HDRVHALVELLGYASLDNQVFAPFHRGQQQGSRKWASVVMNVIAWCGVVELEIYVVPADLPYLALGRQRRRRASAMNLSILDNHLQILGFRACAHLDHVECGA